MTNLRKDLAIMKFLVAWLLFHGNCAAQALSRPVWVEFDSALSEPEYNLRKLLLTNDVCPPQYQRSIDAGALERMGASYYEFEIDNDFSAAGGVATCLDSNGLFVPIRFRLVPSRAVFEKFVADQLQKRGETAVASWKGNDTVTISKPPTPLLTIDGTRTNGTRSSLDLHISYKEGVVVWAAPEVQQVSGAPFNTIVDLAKKASKHDWAFYAAPSEVPSRFRELALRVIDQFLAVELQQRDNEGDREFKARKAQGELRKNIIHQLMNDIDEVFAFVDQPKTDTDFRSGFRVSIAQNSSLAEQVSQLSTTESVSSLDPGDILDAEVNFRVPTEVSKTLNVVVSNSQLSNSAMGRALLAFSQDSLVQFKLLVSGDDSRQTQGVWRSSLSETISREVLEQVGLAWSRPDGGQVPISLLLGQSQFEPWTLYWSLSSEGGRFSLAEVVETKGVEEPVTEPALRHKPLFKLDLDLSNLAEQQTRPQFDSQFELAERLYQQIAYRQNAVILSRRRAGAPIEFVSLASELPDGQPLKLSCSLKASERGTEIVADFRATRGLYAWLLARKRVTEVCLFK